MNGCEQPPNLAGIKPPVGRHDINPLVDPHGPADVGDHRAVDGSDNGRHRHPGQPHRLLEGRSAFRVPRSASATETGK
jgi:hypothetical protein